MEVKRYANLLYVYSMNFQCQLAPGGRQTSEQVTNYIKAILPSII